MLRRLRRFYAAGEEQRQGFAFDRTLDAELRTAPGDARLRGLVARAWREHERPLLRADHERHIVRARGRECVFTVKQVGKRPANGWPLVIAMHGGGGVPKHVNDAQWRHMQVYYRDHPEAGGYLYCALRAPTDEWNGFYTDYFYPVLEKLIRQFVVCDGVDADRVIAIGYSHGGYGAFVVGPKLPHRFAAVHASAAAPTDGQSVPDGLHSLRFSFMVGGRDTAYGRRSRCEAFAGVLAELQAKHPGRYPTRFMLVEDNGHTGLPDRDLLQDLVPLARETTPAQLIWVLSDAVVCDHYWLHTERAVSGRRCEAIASTHRIAYDVGDGPRVEAWLDARLVDLTEPVELAPADGPVRTVQPAPTLATLCRTTEARGDASLAASWIVPLE